MTPSILCSVCAIVVSFQPERELLRENLSIISKQVNAVILVDNASSVSPESLIQDENILFVRLEENSGIAFALNVGISMARERGFEYVIFFDQDSAPLNECIGKLFASYNILEAEGRKVAAVGPRFRDPVNNVISDPLGYSLWGTRALQCDNAATIPVDFLVSSGSLLRIHTIDVVGPMREDLFIDHVDTEWILRAQHYGYRAYCRCDAEMLHSLGEKRRRVWFFRWRNVPFHSSFRYYYIFRNSLLVMRQKDIPLKWKFMEFCRIFKVATFMLIYSEERGEFLRYIFLGYIHGVIGVTGKLR